MLVSWKRALAKLGVSRGFALAAVVARRFSDTLASKLAALAAGGGGHGTQRQFQARLSLYAYISPPCAAEVARRAGEAAQGGEI